MSRHHLLVGSLITALVSIGTLQGGSTSASPRAEAKTRTMRLSATTMSGPTVPGNPTCDPSGRCALGYSITSTYTGDMTGQSVTNGVLYINPATFASQGTSLELFTGTIKGCGSGTFVAHYPLFTGGGANISAKAVIVEGSGTGDLAGISGAITATYSQNATGATSQLKVQVRCRASGSTSSDTTTPES